MVIHMEKGFIGSVSASVNYHWIKQRMFNTSTFCLNVGLSLTLHWVAKHLNCAYFTEHILNNKQDTEIWLAVRGHKSFGPGGHHLLRRKWTNVPKSTVSKLFVLTGQNVLKKQASSKWYWPFLSDSDYQ